MRNPIDINQLKPGDIIFVEGLVKFSRITKHVSGEELEKTDARRKVKIKKPYTNITITQSKILPNTPGSLSMAEEFVQNKFYIASENVNVKPEIYDFQFINKSPYKPQVSQCDPDNPKVCYEIIPEAELAKGLKVILVLQIYDAKKQGFGTNGLGLDGILLREPIRYYEQGRNFAQALAARGITMNSLPDNERPVETETNTEEPAGINEPSGDPYSSSTANTPNTDPIENSGMNVPESDPTANEIWRCDNCGSHNPIDALFCAKCGHKKADDNANTAQPGIRFTD